MNPEEFVKLFYSEKQDALKEYQSQDGQTLVGKLIKSFDSFHKL